MEWTGDAQARPVIGTEAQLRKRAIIQRETPVRWDGGVTVDHVGACILR